MIKMEIGLKKELNIKFDDAVRKVTDELTKLGFGVISTINVKDIIKKKLDKDFRNFLILGACNPEFAHKALEYKDEVSLFMPCNIVIQEKNGVIEVMVFNPKTIEIIFNDDEIRNFTSALYKKIEDLITNL